MPLSWARAGARDGPSVRALLLCLRSKPFAPEVTAREHYLPAAASAGAAPAPPPPAAPLRAPEPLALPLAQAREDAADLLRVDLPPGQVHVRRGDQPPLVAGQRHPLREHVVGVRQAGTAVGARLVRERDAVLVEQLARLRQERDDRLVRVDQVGVRRAGARVVRGRPWPLRRLRHRAPDADEPEVAVHRPLLVVHARAQQLARPLLGAPLAPRVVRGARDDRAARALALHRLSDRRQEQIPQQGDDDDADGDGGKQHFGGPSPRPRFSGSAGRSREEDDALGVARYLLEGLDHLRLAASGGRTARHGGPETLVELPAELLHQTLLVFGHADVALRDEDLSVARLHAQELHRRADYVKGGPPPCPVSDRFRARPPDRRPARGRAARRGRPPSPPAWPPAPPPAGRPRAPGGRRAWPNGYSPTRARRRPDSARRRSRRPARHRRARRPPARDGRP